MLTDGGNPTSMKILMNILDNVVYDVENWIKCVTVLDKIETFDYGKFVHIMDSDGNKIELWEPVDRALTDMDGKTTK